MRLAKVLPQTFAAQKINPPVASTAPLGKNGGLIGAAWIGSETLQGYGQLEFRFEPNQVAVMKDRDGNSYGRWTKTNNQVRLTFYDGTVVYDGRITDKTISGTARNAKGSWTFNVAR
jgi:hypothetical protein